MEPARAPEIVVAPPAAKPAPPRPSRRAPDPPSRGGLTTSPPPLHGTGVLGYVRAELCRSRASWRAPRFLLSGPTRAVWPLNDNRGRYYANLVAHRCLRRSGHRLRDLGHALGALRRCRQRENAGNRRRHPRGRAGLPEAAIFDDRRRRRRHLPGGRLFPRLAGRHRLCGRRHPVRLGRLHRHERVGARQCAHRAGRDQVARRRARNRIPRRRHHRHAGGRPGAARRDALFRLPHRHAAYGAERSRSDQFHGGARLRRLADLDLRPPWRRHFHQGRRRRRRSRRQGRGRHSGRRSTQSGDHRRQRGRQCRRLRRHGGRPVRDLCGDHGRHHGAGRDLLRRLLATCCSR